MTETSRGHLKRDVVWVLVGILALWGVLIFFENTFFAAPAFGFDPPWWVDWVGQIPLWLLNVIDTIAVASLITLTVIAVLDSRHARARHLGTRGGAAGEAVLIVVLLAVAAAVLFAVFHITLSDLIGDLRGFLGQ